jgi:hypothetical protein
VALQTLLDGQGLAVEQSTVFGMQSNHPRLLHPIRLLAFFSPAAVLAPYRDYGSLESSSAFVLDPHSLRPAVQVTQGFPSFLVTDAIP